MSDLKGRSVWFAGADGTRLFYQVTGHGPIDILLFDGIGCDGFIWAYLKPYLEELGRVIHLHMRGHGRSDTPTTEGAATIELLAEDWALLLEREKVKHPVAIGHSMGVQLCLEVTARNPQIDWRGLVLLCGTFEHPVSTFHDTQMLERLLPLLQSAVAAGGTRLRRVWSRLMRTPLAVYIARHSEASPALTRKKDIEAYLNHLARLDPRFFLEMLENAGAHSCRAFLPELEIETLIIAGGRDRFTPARLSEEMAELLPQAELLVIEEGTHTAPIDQTIEVNRRVRQFLRRPSISEGTLQSEGEEERTGFRREE
ncbi:MAG: alpha/beta hydrolase [Myxococcota bacterium]|nr:alpha/beta hydrolase [Myxococcota bacterium]